MSAPGRSQALDKERVARKGSPMSQRGSAAPPAGAPAAERRRRRVAASYGPNPWQQTQWDGRAAANFIGGGCGAGLIVCATLAGAPPGLLLAGVFCVGAGLFCVWLEIGRPLRALHVFFNPFSSWMSREAFVATLLLPLALLAALEWATLALPAAALALAYLFCQSRMLRAARGIPAWREPWLQPLIWTSGLAEGAGLLALLDPAWAASARGAGIGFAVLLVLRAAAWLGYRRRIGAGAAPRALAALDAAGRRLLLGATLLPLLALPLTLMLAASGIAAPLQFFLFASAGLLAWAGGAWFKFVLVTRAGFNQGFALSHLPVRGVPR
ncbi:MAG: dimethyl sulfoxide reductase anchor subunit [Burkholderiales bacterium]|nr:dimethyl sulfoxide reductase anchor subunit [Burkholderiales bacterium]